MLDAFGWVRILFTFKNTDGTADVTIQKNYF
jgi:hypothetical protein